MRRIRVWYFVPVCAVLFTAAPCYASGYRDRQDREQTGETQAVDVHYQQLVQPLQQGDGLVFIGVSGRLSNREDAIRNALEDAARKLSFFDSVRVSSVSWDRRGAGTMDISIGSEYHLHYDQDLEPFINALAFDPVLDVFEINNAVFVVARTAPRLPMPSVIGYTSGTRRPSWVESPPAEIGGYTAGVGFSGPRSSHRDTVVISYERALVNIAENMAIQVRGGQEVYQDTATAFGFALNDTGETSASGTLRNFYIIESWTDPTNLSVWTLAVANRDQ